MNLKKKWQLLKRKLNKITLAQYVTLSLFLVIIYTIIITTLKTITGNDYSTEYMTFCGVFGGESVLCGLIKIFKLKGEDDG